MSPLVDVRGESQRAIFLTRFIDSRLEAITGQAATYTSAASTMKDSEGNTLATILNLPPWRVEGGTMRLQLDGDVDDLFYPWDYEFDEPWSFLIEYRETAAVSDEQIRIGNKDASNPRVLVDYNAGAFRIQHHNGTTNISVSAPAISKTTGDLITVRGIFRANGAINIAASKNGGAEVVGTESAAHTPTAWSQKRLYIVTATAANTSEEEVGRVAFSSDPDATLSELQNLI